MYVLYTELPIYGQYNNYVLRMSFSGIIAGVGIFGPAIAFFLGGLFSRIYVTLEGMYKKRFSSQSIERRRSFCYYYVYDLESRFPLMPLAGYVC